MTTKTKNDDILKRIPPQDLEAEQSVLGAILIDNSTLTLLPDYLDGEDFYREAHRDIYRAMLELNKKQEPIDAVTLCGLLRDQGLLEQIGGPSYIGELAAVVPSATVIRSYARRVTNKANLRRLAAVATDIASSCYENPVDVQGFLEQSERVLFNLASKRQKQTARFITMTEGTGTFIKEVERAQETKTNLVGIATGFNDLDKTIGGLEPGNLILIAARPSAGKTALAINIATNMALDNTAGAVAFFSLEMSSGSIISRFVCSHARLDLLKIRRGYIAQSEYPKLAQACADLSQTHILIDDSASLTPMQLRARCQIASQRAGVPLTCVIVDYLQLMKSNEDRATREREVADVSQALKALAKELKIPVIALSQLSRQVESRSDKHPLLADLRESGSLEQDADIILFIYRDEMYKGAKSKEPGVADIIIAKQRNGPTGMEKLTYISTYTRFENYIAESGVFEPAPENNGWQSND